MKIEYALLKAIDEANCFILKAEMALSAMETDVKRYNQASYKEVASAKRASMELTRSLVDVRNPTRSGN